MNEPHASDHTACVDCSGSISQLPFRTGASYSIAYHEFTPMLVMRVKGHQGWPFGAQAPAPDNCAATTSQQERELP